MLGMLVTAFAQFGLLVSPVVSLHVDGHTGQSVGSGYSSNEKTNIDQNTFVHNGTNNSWHKLFRIRKLKNCGDEPPILTNDTIMGILDVYDASYHRAQRLKFLEAHMNISHSDAKISYTDMHRRCKPMFVRECTYKNAVAIILSGQTRSFLNPEVLLYWQRVLHAIRSSGRLPVIFAVLDEISVSRVQPGKNLVKHNDSIKVLRKVLSDLDAGSNFVFLHGNSSMAEHARYVMDPGIRKMLTPSNDAETKYMGGGSECSFMKMVVGLDLLLQYERYTNTCFSHVFRARPDYVFLNWERPAYLEKVWAELDDVVYLINDVAAMMPREYAGVYFTTFLMHRTIKNPTQKAQKDLLDSFVRNGRRGSLGQPTTWMAYHGIIFTGHGLELDSWKGEEWAGEINDDDLAEGETHGFMVREDAKLGNCIGKESTLITHNVSLPICED